MSSFQFVQLDVPGRIGLDDGRYLIRESGEGDGPGDETVLVVQTLGAPPAGRRPPGASAAPTARSPEPLPRRSQSHASR